MKYSKLYNLIVFLSIILVTSSCVEESDLIQVDPNVNTEGSFWKTDEDAIKGVNAAYASLLTDGTYMRSTPLLLDLKGDDTRSQSPWGSMFNVGRFNSSAADAAIYGWAFETYYQGIYRANQVLERVPEIEMDQALKDRIIGQAHFMRGLFFMHAVKLFKSVPLPLDNSEIYSPQKSNEEGWAQVKADFKMAASLLPNSYNNVTGLDAGQVGRATKGAAYAYLGKAQLFSKEFGEAKISFEEVMKLGYALVPNYRDNFTDTNENNSESVFEVQFSRDAGGVDLGWGGAPSSGWGKTSARAITYGPRGFGWTDVQPTLSLFNDFQIEKTVNDEVDPRLDATMFYNKPGGMMLYGQDFATFYGGNQQDLNDLFCRKYQNSDGGQGDEFDWRSGINERIMRYADVLLMYAECLNETGATGNAYQYIQMVRDRVNLPSLATTKPGMSQQEMRDQIAHERFLEFALEGHRFDDIRRWGWLQNSSKVDWLKTRDYEYDTYKAGREYFPIPQLEMDNNPGTIQNEGY